MAGNRQDFVLVGFSMLGNGNGMIPYDLVAE